MVLYDNSVSTPGGAVTVVVVADCDQYSVVVTVCLVALITVSVPPGGAVTVVVVGIDCDQYSVVVQYGLVVL